MYCNKCGKAVRNDDVYCSYCGNKLNRLNYDFDNEEIIYNVPNPSRRSEEARPAEMFKSGNLEEEIARMETKPVVPQKRNSEFVWDVRDFEVPPKKSEDYVVDWKKLQIYEKDAEKRDEFSELDVSFPRERESGQVGAELFDKETTRIFDKKALNPHGLLDEETLTPFGTAIDAFKEDEARPVSIEDIQEDIDKENADASRDAAKIEKFYTFNQKNEEFQKLLDREYERVNKGRIGDGEEVLSEEALNAKLEEGILAAEEKKASEAEASISIPEGFMEEPAEESASESEKVDAEAEETLEESLETTHKEVETDAKDDWKNLGVFDPEEHLKKAAEEREAAVTVAPDVYDNSSLIKRFDTRELEKDVLEIEIEKERRLREKQRQEAEYEERERILDELYGKLEESPVEQSESARKTSEAYDVEEEKTSADLIAEEKPSEDERIVEQESVSTSEATEDERPSEEIAEGPSEKLDEPEAEEGEIIDMAETKAFDSSLLDQLERVDEEFFVEDEEKRSVGQTILNIIIAIAAICLVVEIAVAGIVHFLPNSGVAKLIEDNIGPVVIHFGETAEPEPEPEPEPVVIPEGTPINLDELVAHAQNFNDNIKTIKADSSFGYDPTATYSEDKILKSTPLEYNIWYKDLDGNSIYVDRCIVDILVKYNSQWIDYATKGDEKVFELLAEEGEVYKSCKSLKNPGSLEKSFEELIIGQIRETEGGYIIWAKETIKGTTSGKTEKTTYNSVYFIADKNYELKIVDCYQL